MGLIRTGMIGTGGISHVHINQLMELEEVEITAIADINETSRDTIISKFPALKAVTQFIDYKDMLESMDLDAVVICTPHTLHYQHVLDALNSGCHVLVEKPMVCSTKEAENLIEAAEDTGRVLQVSYQRHFEPPYLYIKDAINNGEIGKLTSITASLYQDWKQLTAGTWRQKPELSGGGMLMDSGSHLIDVLLWTTGLTPQEARTTLHQQGTPVEINSFTTLRFKEDVIAGINVIGYAPGWYENYVFIGEKGGIFYENGKVTLHRQGEAPAVQDLPQPVTNQDKSFIDTILGRHDVMVPGAFARDVVKCTEMLYTSAGYTPFTVAK